MPDGDSPRRHLIAVGITTGLSSSAPLIVESVNRMTQVLTEDFGYDRVTNLDIDPKSYEIEDEIRKFCLNCNRDDIVTLYYTAHADDVNGSHRVWTGNTRDRFTGTLETRRLAELILADTPLRYALIIIDTCFAGQGGAEALLASMPSIGEGDGKTLAVLTAAYQREQIVAGDFARLFERAVAQPSVAGSDVRYLVPDAIAGVIHDDPSRPGWQTISSNLLGARSDQLPYFPNPRFNPRLRDLDMLSKLRIEQGELRLEDLHRHFLTRARGVDVPTEPGWWFVGRKEVLRDLVSWLKDRGDLSARVVTGGPGSGKSAVIGLLAVLSDHGERPAVPLPDLAADTIPPEGGIATAIHARGLTTSQVLTALSAVVDVQVRADTPAELLRQMRGQKLTVAIDAIDEALDPPGLVDQVLRPLVQTGPAEGLRLLLGTRPHLLEALGMTRPALDLDDEHYADLLSLREYVISGLHAGDPGSPYHSAPEALVAEIARAVAAAAGHSFLVALIVSRTLVSVTDVPDPTDPAWRDSLPGNAADAMRNDLETRLGADADRARDLLRPLAFAQGAGLPWPGLWASLSSRLGGHIYTEEDIKWLVRQAGSYVVEAVESGRSVYRLYHAALAEYLRQDCDEGRVHGLFTAFLQERVPMSRQGPDWSRAHPYILAHLATHAQRSGMLDNLLLDPGYLVNAASAGLLAALPAARDPDAELAGRAYQRAAHQLREQAGDSRFSYLELAARITHAAELASRIAVMAPQRRWSVPWTHWPPEHPHRILDGHLGPLNGVMCVHLGGGSFVVASIGEDAKLRTWDAITAERRGTYTIGEAPLIAARVISLPGHQTVIVLLAADGLLYTWDMSTATLLRKVPVAPLWRRAALLWNADLTLRCFGTPDGRQFAVTGASGTVAGASGIRTCIWDLSTGRLVAGLSSRAAPGAIELTALIDGRTVIVASMGGAERWTYDLQTGTSLPYEHRRIRSAWLRSRYDRLIRRSFLTYYAFRDGPPLVAVRFFRKTAMVWDLTASRPCGIWRRGGDDASVKLTDGRTVTIPLPLQQKTSRFSFFASQLQTISQEYRPAEGSDVLVPLGPLARRQDQSDTEPDAPQFRITDRFLRVQVQDSSHQPGHEPVSLTLAGHAASVTAYDWIRLPEGHVIVFTGSRDGTVRRWDTSSITPSAGEGSEQSRVALHHIVSTPLDDGTSIGLAMAQDEDVTLWNLRTGELTGDLAGHAESFAVDVVRPRGGLPIAVTYDADQTMRIWSLPDGYLTASFRHNRIRWPGDMACTRLPDGSCVAITSGHGRKSVVWDLTTGRIRNVLSGHRGRTACVTCVDGRELWPLALTGGFDNRVNVWDLRHGRRKHRFRIVPPWTFLVRPSAGHARSVRAATLDSGRLLALIATSNGTVRALERSRFPFAVRRSGTVSADAVGTAVLSTGRTVVVTATGDGIIRIWKPETLTDRADSRMPLCEINIEIPVSDVAFADDDTFVIATPNGLTAIRLDARLLDIDLNSSGSESFVPTAARAAITGLEAENAAGS
jgi:WD40 repeat protein